MNLNQITLGAADIAASAAFYLALGLRLIVSSPHYARFDCENGDATLSVHLASRPLGEAMTGNPSPQTASAAVVYFEAESALALDAKVSELVRAGLVFKQLPIHQSWLWREARLRDPFDNEICLYWAGINRKNPPWRVGGPLEPLSTHLEALETELLQHATRTNAVRVAALLHDDFSELGQSGVVWTKAAIIERLQSETPSTHVARRLSAFKVIHTDANTACVTYTAARYAQSEHGEPSANQAIMSHSGRSSVWVLFGGKWRMLHHQGTLLDSKAQAEQTAQRPL